MICEMYIDDCTVFGDINIEFLSRLKLILFNLENTTFIFISKLLNAFSATLNLSSLVELFLKKDYKYPVRKYSLYSTFRYPL